MDINIRIIWYSLLISLSLLSYLYSSLVMKNDRSKSRCFLLIFISVLSILSVDFLTIAYFIITDSPREIVSRTLTTLLYMLAPLLSLLIFYYSNISMPKRLSKKTYFIFFTTLLVFVSGYLITLAINKQITINMATGFANVNAYFFGYVFLVMLPLALSLIQVIYYKNKLKKSTIVELIIINIVPFVSIIFALTRFFNQVLLTSFLVVQVLIALNKLYRASNYDYLTRLSNRRLLVSHLNKVLRNQKTNQQIFVYILDIDNFKTINDTFGHFTGDTVLTNISAIITSTFSKNTFIARLGGDEFLVVNVASKNDDPTQHITTINNACEKLTILGNNHALSLSGGYKELKRENLQSVDDFLDQIDKSMFASKFAKKRKTIND